MKRISLPFAFIAVALVAVLLVGWGPFKPSSKESPAGKQRQAEKPKLAKKFAFPGKQRAEQPAPRRDGWVSVVYSKDYLVSLAGLERLHSFDIRKYQKIHDQLVADKLLTAAEVLRPAPLTVEDIRLVHSQQFVDSLEDKNEVAAYLEAPPIAYLPNFIINRSVLKPFRMASGGTLLAARKALEHGIGVNVGGGYHHAKIDTGEGFCIYADVPIAIRKLQKEKKIARALIIDVDAHQGNGTVVCLADDDSTYTFSMHQGNIYPVPKEDSDWDIELDAGTSDNGFMALLEPALPKLFEQARPDIVFIVGGCDTLSGDPLAQLAMTEQGIARRDKAIVQACVERKVPVVLTLSGGYSKNAWHAQYLSIKSIIEAYGMANNGG